MLYRCRQVHTNTPQVVVGIVEPRTPRLTSRSASYRTGFLLSATNTQYEEVEINGRNPVCRFSPKCLEHTQEQEIEIGVIE